MSVRRAVERTRGRGGDGQGPGSTQAPDARGATFSYQARQHAAKAPQVEGVVVLLLIYEQLGALWRQGGKGGRQVRKRRKKRRRTDMMGPTARQAAPLK